MMYEYVWIDIVKKKKATIAKLLQWKELERLKKEINDKKIPQIS